MPYICSPQSIMEYIQLNIKVRDESQAELLIALLSAAGFDGFEEQPGSLIAIIPAGAYNRPDAAAIIAEAGASFEELTVQQQNWNAIWEADFQPVAVKDFCTVRASFHPPATDTPYEIIITPKMSFGTGHHATTQLMIEAMQTLAFPGKKVLDFGTGTGILAILARKLGATDILAIDHDEWSIRNTGDNARMNEAPMDIRQGSLDDMPPAVYDVILANINRNILLQYMEMMAAQLAPRGTLLLSGILEEDITAIQEAAAAQQLVWQDGSARSGWQVLRFNKEHSL